MITNYGMTIHANERVAERLGSWYDARTAARTMKSASQHTDGKFYVIVRKFEKVEQNPISNRFGKFIIAVIENGNVKTFLVEKEINPKIYTDGKLTSFEKIH
jgi:hypothetical protein